MICSNNFITIRDTSFIIEETKIPHRFRNDSGCLRRVYNNVRFVLQMRMFKTDWFTNTS